MKIDDELKVAYFLINLEFNNFEIARILNLINDGCTLGKALFEIYSLKSKFPEEEPQEEKKLNKLILESPKSVHAKKETWGWAFVKRCPNESNMYTCQCDKCYENS